MKQGRQTAHGKFITLEGVEGVGKSTHLDYISRYLQKHGIRVRVTREPGGTPAADEIRKILLANRTEQFQPTAELLLMFAARALHVENVIRPTLTAGTWIVCDRFTDASYAYQGGGRGIAAQHIESLERMVLHGLRPDLTILLDARIEVGLARVKRRGALDRFEHERDDFFKRVRGVYLKRARRNPRRIKMVNAGGRIADVQAEISAILDQRLARWL
ncbi:MAG TPA: dTMP kinase [Gammaproteobacteria bacterium]|nr:dTMP kinase [Gammaproteobacteria bacterium]